MAEREGRGSGGEIRKGEGLREERAQRAWFATETAQQVCSQHHFPSLSTTLYKSAMTRKRKKKVSTSWRRLPPTNKVEMASPVSIYVLPVCSALCSWSLLALFITLLLCSLRGERSPGL